MSRAFQNDISLKRKNTKTAPSASGNNSGRFCHHRYLKTDKTAGCPFPCVLLHKRSTFRYWGILFWGKRIPLHSDNSFRKPSFRFIRYPDTSNPHSASQTKKNSAFQSNRQGQLYL